MELVVAVGGGGAEVVPFGMTPMGEGLVGLRVEGRPGRSVVEVLEGSRSSGRGLDVQRVSKPARNIRARSLRAFAYFRWVTKLATSMILRSLVASVCATYMNANPVEITPPEMRGAQQPQVALGEHGEVNIVFGFRGSIYHTVSTAAELHFSPPVKIAELPKLALGMHRGPRIEVAGRRLIVTAISHEAGDLLAWTSDDHGKSWSGAAKVNTVPKSAREGLHAMAASGSRVAVAWLDLRGGKTELWLAISTDGAATWQPDACIYHSPGDSICQCCAPSLAFGKDGKLAVMWRNEIGGARDLYIALSGNGGNTFGPAGKLGTGTWKLNACPMDGGDLAFSDGGSGKIATVWRRDKTLYLSSPGLTEEPLGDGRDATMAGTPKGIVLAWNSTAGLVVRDPTGNPRIMDDQGGCPSLASAADSSFSVVVWESGSKETSSLKAEILRWN